MQRRALDVPIPDGPRCGAISLEILDTVDTMENRGLMSDDAENSTLEMGKGSNDIHDS